MCLAIQTLTVMSTSVTWTHVCFELCVAQTLNTLSVGQQSNRSEQLCVTTIHNSFELVPYIILLKQTPGTPSVHHTFSVPAVTFTEYCILAIFQAMISSTLIRLLFFILLKIKMLLGLL